MILLDTNVVSALMSPHRETVISAFMAGIWMDDVHVPSLVVAELRFGIERLAMGRRRTGLSERLETFLSTGPGARVIDFDAESADSYAIARTRRERTGRPVDLMDCLIGGMALAYGATLATRNVADFTGYGLTIVDPWSAG